MVNFSTLESEIIISAPIKGQSQQIGVHMGRLISLFPHFHQMAASMWQYRGKKSPESKSITPLKKKRRCYLWLGSGLGQPAPHFILAMVKTKNLQSFLLRLLSILTSKYNKYSVI